MKTNGNATQTESNTNDQILALLTNVVGRLEKLEAPPEPKPAPAKQTAKPRASKPADPPVFDFHRTANGNISLKISNARSKYNFLVLAPEIWAELADRLPRALANEANLPVYGK